jgi:hypothetical protein
MRVVELAEKGEGDGRGGGLVGEPKHSDVRLADGFFHPILLLLLIMSPFQ